MLVTESVKYYRTVPLISTMTIPKGLQAISKTVPSIHPPYGLAPGSGSGHQATTQLLKRAP